MSRERILCAAIWFDDGKEYLHQPSNVHRGHVLCGHRHCSVLGQTGELASERRERGVREERQGFLTSANRFVDRCEAAAIALAAGQIKHRVNTLTSEDLY